MIAALVGTVAAAVAVAAAPGDPVPPQTMAVSRHASAAEAVRAALASSASLAGPAVVVGFGEIHQTEATARIPSALRRFTEQILPSLAPELSHLIVETWMTTGRCGEVERAVTADIEKTTERPAATENEIETVLRRAAEAGIAPRILSIGCADYQAMRPAPGQPVDYDRTLRVTERALETAALRALALAPAVPQRRRTLVALYGGALHNDAHPNPLLRAYSYAPALQTATLGHYVEIDLVVPEYVDPPRGAARAKGERENRAKYPWWIAYRSAEPGKAKPSKADSKAAAGATAARSDVLLVRCSPHSYVVVFPRIHGLK